MESLLRVEEYEEAYVLPVGGVYKETGEFVPYTSKRKYGGSEWLVLDSIVGDDIKNTAQYCDEEVIYLGFLRQHYGHFLIDSCGRMWAVQGRINAKFVFVAHEDYFCEFVDTFMNGLGAKNYQIITTPMRFKKVIVPEISFYPMESMNVSYWIAPFDCVIRKWLLETNVVTSSKIYLSQSEYRVSGHRYGEKLIESIFRNNGYEVLYPEKMSLYNQVCAYNNASTVVCTGGTLAHNGVWMRNNQRLVVLKRMDTVSEYNPHQSFINSARSINYVEINSCWKYSIHDVSCMKLTGDLIAWMESEKMVINNSTKQHLSYCMDVIKYIIFRVKWKMAKLIKHK